ncbi:multidrug export protein MepA [Clostridiales bacterium]|nr:multidrug export protein MepA [Clostridiales bacterium]
MNKSPLETEPISKLILHYSVPTALTLMVNYLYNIVDQIFVGQGVGITGMAATNVAFPFTILVNSIALLIGDGCAANINLCLGKNQKQTADETVSHALSLLIIFGVTIAVLCRIFSPQIVMLFGSTEAAYSESLAYMRTVAIGIPFQMLCPAMTAIIRADGTPKYAMKCMIIGAVINLILDPIFIFPLNMGVTGAAIATVIGQVVAGILCISYFKRLKSVHIIKKALTPTRQLSLRIFALGFPSMLTQILAALVQIVMNNLMTVYGEQTIYGGDIAISAYGMIMKVYQISHSMFVGVSSATQPINGFNYGAKHYRRVHQTYKTAAKIAIAISILWFVIFQAFPANIAGLFVSDNMLYIDCAKHCFRLYMAAFFVYGLHMTTASFFQGIGRPQKALLIPLIRQGVFLIPLAVILSGIFGFSGALIAAPIADVFSFLISLALAIGEFRSWETMN